MSDGTFFQGCATREDEIRLLTQMADQNRTLRQANQTGAQALERAQGAVDGALGRGAGGGAPEPDPIPDPIHDLDGFMANLHADREKTTQRFDQQRVDASEEAQLNAVWDKFQRDHPDLVEHPTVVRAAFMDVTNNTGRLPADPAGIAKVESDLTRHLQTILGVTPAAGDPAAGGPTPTPDPQRSDALMPAVPVAPTAPAVPPQTAEPLPAADPNRTAGIHGGSPQGGAPGTAPANREPEVIDFVTTLRNVRKSDAMKRYFD